MLSESDSKLPVAFSRALLPEISPHNKFYIIIAYVITQTPNNSTLNNIRLWIQANSPGLTWDGKRFMYIPPAMHGGRENADIRSTILKAIQQIGAFKQKLDLNEVG